DGDGVVATADASTSVVGNLPPVISGVSSPTVLQVGQTGTWSVSASDPQNGNLSYNVDWGDNAPRPLFSALARPAFTQNSTFTHSYAGPGTYTVTFTVSDSVGLSSRTSVTVHVTSNESNEGAPVISGLSATSTHPDQGILTWTTNEKTRTVIWYGTSSPVDTSGTPGLTRDDRVTGHKVVIDHLAAGTTYYAVIEAIDDEGQASTSSEVSFSTTRDISTTTASTSPTITDAVATVGTDSVKLTWNTADAADSEVYYSTSSPVVIGASSTQAITDATLATSHEVTVSGLTAATTYRFIIRSVDSNSNSQQTGEFSLTTAPVI
ncbi:MAG: PKD domain-containing protein, partial [Patescibacteria group bacterium]|nr:PKD domain-containing protein [Patescibacteria group bacterium]